MMEWLMSLDPTTSLFIVVGFGIAMGALFTLFGEVVTPEEVI